MAKFIAKNLSVLAYAGGDSMDFGYQHTGALAEVVAPGFFDDGGDYVRVGNRISVTAADASAELLCVSHDNKQVRVVQIVPDTQPGGSRWRDPENAWRLIESRIDIIDDGLACFHECASSNDPGMIRFIANALDEHMGLLKKEVRLALNQPEELMS